MLAYFSAAQPTSIHRRIMLARGVIVPQRQTLRAVAFPAAVVGEAIHAPVADAERRLLEHHVHRDHSALVSRESCATRSVAADINTHHPATPSSHIERPKFSTSTAGETRGSVAATSDSPPPAQRTRRASRMSADLGSRACCAPADDRRSGVVIGRQEVIDLAQLLDILDNAVDDRTDRWGRRLDFNVHTMGRCPFRRRWPGIGRRNADESGLRGLFLPAATAGHRPREHGGRDNHDVDFQFLNCC